MKEFLWLALLSILTGLTYIAYKHPAGYRRIYWFAGFSAGAVGIMSFVWTIARDVTFNAILPFLRPDKIEAAKAAVQSIQMPLWAAGLLLAVATYLLILAFLPNILGMPDGRQRGVGNK